MPGDGCTLLWKLGIESSLRDIENTFTRFVCCVYPTHITTLGIYTLKSYKSTTVTGLPNFPLFPYMSDALAINAPLLVPGPSMIHFHRMLLMP
jgi:hypothetical protein